MSNKLQNIVTAIADKLFLPVDVEYKNYFSLPLKAIVLSYFAYCGVIALPPIIDIVVYEKPNALPFIDLVIADPEYWKEWLPYWNFVLEIIFFIMIGGSVFSEWAAANSKKAFERYALAVEKARKRDLENVKDELVTKLKDYYALLEGINAKNFLQRIHSLFKSSRDIIHILGNDATKVNAKFVASKMTVSFPGGYYGLFAFFLFAALIQIKIAQMYLPHNG